VPPRCNDRRPHSDWRFHTARPGIPRFLAGRMQQPVFCCRLDRGETRSGTILRDSCSTSDRSPVFPPEVGPRSHTSKSHTDLVDWRGSTRTRPIAHPATTVARAPYLAAHSPIARRSPPCPLHSRPSDSHGWSDLAGASSRTRVAAHKISLAHRLQPAASADVHILKNRCPSFLRLLASLGWQHAGRPVNVTASLWCHISFKRSGLSGLGCACSSRRFPKSRSQPNISGNKLLWVRV